MDDRMVGWVMTSDGWKIGEYSAGDVDGADVFEPRRWLDLILFWRPRRRVSEAIRKEFVSAIKLEQ